MSDFLFSSRPRGPGRLAAVLEGCQARRCGRAREFHGAWGSLAVTPSRYPGFQPLETGRYLCVVLGGPLLDASYPDAPQASAAEDPQAGTRALLEHWQRGDLDWAEALSGPFVFFVVDKQAGDLWCVTDLMLFIPVYRYQEQGGWVLGSHVDAVAEASGRVQHHDEVSLADFVLHHVVTWPYTVYRDVRQCHPGSVHRLSAGAGGEGALSVSPYWEPREENPFGSLTQAAECLRGGVQEYIERVCDGQTRVAQFISAGEDSRALAGMLPARLQRDAFIFLDNMNREGRIARKVALAYGARFIPDFRSTAHYVEILEEASRLTGGGHQYAHAHTLGFHETHGLAEYGAVFGGYFSDSLLKGQFCRKAPRHLEYPFMPQQRLGGERRTQAVTHPLFEGAVLEALTERRRRHYARLVALRPDSADEWFELWPATMRLGMPNLYVNRRLFASHEVFMAREAVKVGAAVPVAWKLNRRLFHAAFKPALARSWSVLHADGRLPYLPWWASMPVQFSVWAYREAHRRLGFPVYHEGPWGSWGAIMVSDEWRGASQACAGLTGVPEVLQPALQAGALSPDSELLDIMQKSNLMQLCLTLSGESHVPCLT